MRLILLTSERRSVSEPEVIAHALREGFERVHIKREGLTVEESIGLLAHFKKDKRIVMHTRHEVAKAFGVSIHLSESSRTSNHDPEAISTSFHSVEDLVGNYSGFTYSFIGPVYDSISKVNYPGKIDLSAIPSHIRKFVVPIGGMTKDRIHEVRAKGYSSIAFRGTVWNSADPFSRIDEIVEKVSDLSSITHE